MKKIISLVSCLFLVLAILTGFTSENIPLQNWQTYLIGDPISSDDELYYLIEAQDNKVSNAEKTGVWDTLNTDGGNLYNDLDMSKSSSLTEISNRLRSMALCFSTPSSQFYNNQELLNDIEYGLQYFSDNLYNTSVTEYDNWWDFEIGVSLKIDDILILLNNNLDQDLVDSLLATIDFYIPDPSIDKWGNPSTGANLLDRTLAKSLRYVVSGDVNKQKETVKKIDPAFEFVQSGDGFYEDGGFIQHGTLPYTASYGGVLLYDAMMFEVLYEGTNIIPDSSQIKNLPFIIENNFVPFLYDSQMLFSTRGRSVSREATGNADARKILIASYVIGEKSGDEEFTENISAFVKYQIENDDVYDEYYSGLKIFDAQQLEKLLNDPNVHASNIQKTSKYYNSVDMLNFFGDDYLVNLRLNSPELSSTEIGNGENKLGYMQGVGTTYIYNGDQHQYNSEYVATINPYNYPGTTTDYVFSRQDPETWGVQFNTSNWVGGVTATNGASATTLQTLDKVTGSDLTARKSWFFFDDEFISLGVDINSSASKVDTTIANTKLGSDSQSLYVDGNAISNYNGKINDVFVENPSGSLGTGYYMYDSPNGKAILDERHADYSDINDGREGAVNETFATVTIDNSDVDTYAYVTLPNVSQEQLNTYIQEPDIKVLENSSDASVVYSKKEDTIMANVYTKYMTKNIKVNNPACIIIENASSKSPTIYVSDPTETTDTIDIIINKNPYSNVTTNDNVYFKGNKLYFDMSEHNGSTVSATIS